MARWQELLQEFNFEVIHLSGHSHSNANALSLLQIPRNRSQQDRSKCDSCPTNPQRLHMWQAWSSFNRKTKILVSSIRHYAGEQGYILHILKGKGRSFRELVQQWDQLLLKDSGWYEESSGKHHLQVVVPKVSWSDIHCTAPATWWRIRGPSGRGKNTKLASRKISLARSCRWCMYVVEKFVHIVQSEKWKAPLQGIVTGYQIQMVAVRTFSMRWEWKWIRTNGFGLFHQMGHTQSGRCYSGR